MTARTTVSVRDVDPATLPPIPDRAVVETWLADSRRRGVEAGPPPREAAAGHYQHVVLDTRTGELFFHAGDWRVPAPAYHDHDREAWAAYYGPGTRFSVGGTPHQWFTPVPERVRWVVDSGVPDRPYLTAGQAQSFLHTLAPLAQTLVDHLLPVAGTTDRDWSPESGSAGLDIHRACSRHPQPPRGLRRNLVTLEQVMAALPWLVSPDWAGMDPATLDGEAEHLTRLTVLRHPILAELFGLDDTPGDQRGNLQILAARAWLRGIHPLAGPGTPADPLPAD